MRKYDGLTQIVKEVQKDIGKFELLHSQIVNKVYFWCYTIAGDEATANDMTQEAMILIYQKVKTLQNPENFTSWMYRLVRNSSINYLRANKKHKLEFLQNEEFNNDFEANIKEERRDNLPEEAYYQKEKKQLIRSFIDKLPRKQKEVVILYYLEELKIKEIAETLDCNAGSVRTRLFAGRKNLEKQVNDYQIKNNIKLYSSAAIPALSVLIKEYQDDICNNQNLQYSQSTYTNTSSAGSTSGGVGTSTATSAGTATGASTVTIGGITIVTTKLVAIIVSVVCICVSVAVADTILNNSNHLDDTTGESSVEHFQSKDKENNDLVNKLKGHPYIEDISYLEFPMKNNVDITVELKKNIDEKDLMILYEGEEIPFKRSGNNILMSVSNNGTYTIVIKDDRTSFMINNIDIYAPELVEAFNDEGYLLLVINDELSQLDYSKSFVECNNERYKIPENFRIKGEFYGKVRVTLFHHNGYKIVYELDFG